ncbi:MAG: CRTAC1 family protein [Planctomycetales bacterium]|nr:CRTAC1 family protein [Planctomycetales bacterium]
MMTSKHLAALLFVAMASAVTSYGEIKLTDVTAGTGITFRHTDGSNGAHYIVEYVSAGLALFDFDNDGDIDIYFLNGAAMKGTDYAVAPRNALYRNDGNWKFTDVTEQAGVGDRHHGLGVTVGDYDNDGDSDLYLNNYGPNVLYRNDGDGTFTDVTASAGVANGNKVGAGTCFLDIEGDGDLDLYVANYIKFDFSKHVARTKRGFPVYGSPLDYRPEHDSLYQNNGDGTFSDISKASGIARHAAYGMGMVCCDIDQDRDTDILVGNDTGANYLFKNNGKGIFQESGLISGFAYDRIGGVQGTMGVDVADFDNDGKLDIHVTSYQNEVATLYRNVGDGFLEDITNPTGIGAGTSQPVTWGNGFVDFDNDGDRDVFIACGHLYDNVELFDDQSEYEARNMLFENLGNGKFAEVTATAGSGLAPKLSSRGAAFGDLDNDGDIDAVILNSRSMPTIIRNDTSSANWLQIRLHGVQSNRDGVGAFVEIMCGKNRQVAEVLSGRGYQGHFGSRLHFGLGEHSQVDQVRIWWLGGRTDVLKNVRPNQVLTVTESIE